MYRLNIPHDVEYLVCDDSYRVTLPRRPMKCVRQKPLRMLSRRINLGYIMASRGNPFQPRLAHLCLRGLYRLQPLMYFDERAQSGNMYGIGCVFSMLGKKAWQRIVRSAVVPQTLMAVEARSPGVFIAKPAVPSFRFLQMGLYCICPSMRISLLPMRLTDDEALIW